MVTFEQLVERALGTIPVADGVVRAIVRSTIDGLGFHVDERGEVYDPRPQPTITFPEQRGLRYIGQPPRRRGHRR